MPKKKYQDSRSRQNDHFSPPVLRRAFLTAGGAIGTSLLAPRLLGGAGNGEAHAAEHLHDTTAEAIDAWKDFVPGAPFVEPEIRRSVNGELRTTLRLQYAYKNVGGYRLYVRTYEGTVPGPTLRARPGTVPS